MRSYGYGSYHGRSRLRSVLKGIIILLAAVLIVAIAAFLFLQRYMVFSADGVRFELPFLQGQQEPADPDPVLVHTPEPVLVTPTPSPAPEALHAVELTRQALYDGTAAEQVAAAGGNAALFDMKGDDGSLGYISGIQLAKDIRSSASDPALNGAIQGLNAGELYTIARVSCFRDNALPYYRNDLALRSLGGGNWKDDERIRWASPANEAVQDYVAGVCAELAELGFDEILLDNAAYPTRGKLTNIKSGEDYAPDRLEETVEAFYAKVAQVLEPYDVKLSIVGTAAAAEGIDSDAGQSAVQLIRCADRVWLRADGEGADYAGMLERSGLADARVNCVLWTETAGEAQESWALGASQ